METISTWPRGEGIRVERQIVGWGSGGREGAEARCLHMPISLAIALSLGGLRNTNTCVRRWPC